MCRWDCRIFHRDLRLQNLHLHGSHFEPLLKITGFSYSKSALLDSQPKASSHNTAKCTDSMIAAPTRF